MNKDLPWLDASTCLPVADGWYVCIILPEFGLTKLYMAQPMLKGGQVVADYIRLERPQKPITHFLPKLYYDADLVYQAVREIRLSLKRARADK